MLEKDIRHVGVQENVYVQGLGQGEVTPLFIPQKSFQGCMLIKRPLCA